MKDVRIIVAALAALSMGYAASAGVITSASAPTTDILFSMDAGVAGIDTSLFDEDANANHSRGQLFSLPDGPLTGYEITAITVKKSNNQTYVDDTVTLRFFEGSSAQWDTGTGHSTADDGDNYYVDTTVTHLTTESFTLSGVITNNHFVTFELVNPLVVNEDSDFGFFMIYDQVSGTQARFRHRENSDGGRISITTTDHGVSSRNIVSYVQGAAIPEPGTAALFGLAALGLTLARRRRG